MPSKKYVDPKNPVASCSTAYHHISNVVYSGASTVCSNHLQSCSTSKVYTKLYVEKRKNCYSLLQRDQLLPLIPATLKSRYNLSCTTDQLTAPRIFPCFPKRSLFPLVFYWHVISVLTCLMVTGFTVRASVINDIMPNSSVTLLTTSTSSIYQNPLLRHLRSKNLVQPVCLVWTSKAPKDLCKETPRERLRKLKEMFVFSRDIEEPNNISIAQLFKVQTLTPSTPKTEFLKRLKHLKEGAYGRDCIAASDRTVCEKCFKKLDVALQNVDVAYSQLNSTLHRFDCMRASDTATATRPFSSIGSCYACKIWYRYWLLVHSLNLLREPPCLDWCDYAQRACPYLTPTKSAEFAGHPSFQCRDLQISINVKNTNVFDLGFFPPPEKPRCDCFHPCDLFGNVLVVPSSLREVEGHFFSPKRCRERQRQCFAKKRDPKLSHHVRADSRRQYSGDRSKAALQSTNAGSLNRTFPRIRQQSSRKETNLINLARSRSHNSVLLNFFFLLLHLLRHLSNLEQI